MENKAIKVNVGELEYMVRAKSDEHEAVVREAERSLNEMITKYRRLYPQKDIVDLLAFVALNQCITNVGFMTEQDYKDYREYEEAHARILAKTPERQWREELCPVLSQCYLGVDGGDENTYTLFLRIRSLDYWSFSVIQCMDTDRPKWYCPDGFPYFEQEQLKAAEAWAEYWYETHKDHIPELFKEEEV